MASERDDRISLDVSNIRTAVYGVEVRESIADGIEQCYLEAKELESSVDTRFTETTESIDEVANELTDALPVAKTVASFCTNASIDTNGVISEGNATRLLSSLFTANVGDTFTIPSTYGLRVAGYKDGAFVSYPVNDWGNSFTVTQYMASTYDQYRINIRNNSNTSAVIKPDDVTYTTTIEDLIVHLPIASENDVNAVIDKYLTASFSKTYATTEANQQISLTFDLYAVAGSTITIEQTTGSVVAGSQYTVNTTPAKTGETGMSYSGVVQATQRFKYSFTASVDLQKVTLIATVNAQAVHTFKITYLPGANQIANEKPSLTLYEGHNAVTMTAAQLRQLLALLN